MADISSKDLQGGVADWLISRDRRIIFGLMGVGNLELIARLDERGATFVSGRHENGVVAAADGWARVTGDVGVATVSRGAGLSNAATALVESRKSGTPLVLLVGEQSPSPADTQHLDQGALITSIGIQYVRLRDDDLDGALSAIFAHALDARTPVVVELAAGSDDIDFPASRPVPEPDAAAVDAALKLLSGARRPVILAGRGAVLADAGSVLVTLADRTGAVLTTSAVANGMFTGDARDLGVCGGFASASSAAVLRHADLVLVFGASLNPWTLRHGTLFGDAVPFVRCDADRGVLDRDDRSSVRILGDAGVVAERLVRALPLPRGEAIDWADRPEPLPTGVPAVAGRLDPEEVCRVLGERLPRARTLSVDSGHFFGFPMRHIQPDTARSNVFSQAFLSMGLSIASGIGAALARPDALSVVVAGDGGTTMSLGELDTAVRHELRLLVCIMNDAAFGMEVHELGRYGHLPHTAQFADIDFAAVARGLGACGASIRTLDDLDVLDGWLADPHGPLVLDCKIDPTKIADWYLERTGTHPLPTGDPRRAT